MQIPHLQNLVALATNTEESALVLVLADKANSRFILSKLSRFEKRLLNKVFQPQAYHYQSRGGQSIQHQSVPRA
jgi:hypothetical protein